METSAAVCVQEPAVWHVGSAALAAANGQSREEHDFTMIDMCDEDSVKRNLVCDEGSRPQSHGWEEFYHSVSMLDFRIRASRVKVHEIQAAISGTRLTSKV